MESVHPDINAGGLLCDSPDLQVVDLHCGSCFDDCVTQIESLVGLPNQVGFGIP